jgi:hypothetical protein
MNTTQSFISKLLLLAGAAVAILVGSLLIASPGAHADTASSTAPVISNITATPSDTGATITWTTDQNANTQVLYGPTSMYNASSTFNSALSTAHTAFLGGLSPNTLYHFQLVSGNASGTMATSSDMTFMTLAASSSVATTSTSLPVITNVTATTTDTGATITWNTNVGSNSQVTYGTTTNYGNFSTLNTSSVLSHLVTLMGLTANTLYHYQTWSATTSATGVASSSDFTFTTQPTATTSTSTPPTTGSSTVDMLQAQVAALQTQINGLLARINILENFLAMFGFGGGGTGTTTPPTTGTGTVDQNGLNINAGGSIDLSGRNFGHEEAVTVTLNGATVATAHADGGGNFSTGSIAAPTTAGSYVYHFVGQTSGITANATVTVH